MRLLIKQRVFSWTDSYDVYDENGNVKYILMEKQREKFRKSLHFLILSMKLISMAGE